MIGLKHDPACTANDQINIMIVRGLLIIDALMWLAIFGLLYTGRSVPDTIVLAAVGIGSGFLGYLTREYTGGSGSTGVSTENVGTVNVEAPAEPPRVPSGSGEVAEEAEGERRGS